MRQETENSHLGGCGAFLKKKKKERKERERKKKDGQVWSVGKGESLSLLTGWPFKMTEVSVISVQLGMCMCWHAPLLLCVCVCVGVCEAEWRWHARESNMYLCDTLKRQFITERWGVRDTTDGCGKCCSLACVAASLNKSSTYLYV